MSQQNETISQSSPETSIPSSAEAADESLLSNVSFQSYLEIKERLEAEAARNKKLEMDFNSLQTECGSLKSRNEHLLAQIGQKDKDIEKLIANIRQLNEQHEMLVKRHESDLLEKSKSSNAQQSDLTAKLSGYDAQLRQKDADISRLKQGTNNFININN